jgi:hypothetical protein
MALFADVPDIELRPPASTSDVSRVDLALIARLAPIDQLEALRAFRATLRGGRS